MFDYAELRHQATAADTQAHDLAALLVTGAPLPRSLVLSYITHVDGLLLCRVVYDVWSPDEVAVHQSTLGGLILHYAKVAAPITGVIARIHHLYHSLHERTRSWKGGV